MANSQLIQKTQSLLNCWCRYLLILAGGRAFHHSSCPESTPHRTPTVLHRPQAQLRESPRSMSSPQRAPSATTGDRSQGLGRRLWRRRRSRGTAEWRQTWHAASVVAKGSMLTSTSHRTPQPACDGPMPAWARNSPLGGTGLAITIAYSDAWRGRRAEVNWEMSTVTVGEPPILDWSQVRPKGESWLQWTCCPYDPYSIFRNPRPWPFQGVRL